MYERILVPVDLEQESSWRTALPQAVELAQFYRAKLYLATLALVPQPSWEVPEEMGSLSTLTRQRPSEGVSPASEQDSLYQKAGEGLATLRREYVPGDLEAKWVVRLDSGPICQGIRQLASELHADLIVMASSYLHWSEHSLDLECNAARVVRDINCSVFVVRP